VGLGGCGYSSGVCTSSAVVVDQLVSDTFSGDASRGVQGFDKPLVSGRVRFAERGSGLRAEERKLRMSVASFGSLLNIFTVFLGDFRTAFVSSSRPNLRLVLWRGVKDLLVTVG
jgi:hypothetical protein